MRYLIFSVCLLLGGASLGQESQTKRTETGQKRSTHTPSANLGKAFVQTGCTACHSQMVIQTAHKSEKGWESTLRKMESQGMPTIPPALEPILLEYLTRQHGPETETRRLDWTPWATRDHANALSPN